MPNPSNNLIKDTIIGIISVIFIFLVALGVNNYSEFYNLNFMGKKESNSRNFASNIKIQQIRLPIITYHYVEVVTDKRDFIRKGLSVTPYTFERTIKDFLHEGYSFYFVKDIPDLVNSNTDVKSFKGAVLTFDDGYTDFYTDAFPILKKYNIKATIYIVYNFIGRLNYMTENQINEIAKSGLIEIGAHTLDHLDLISIKYNEAKYQIEQSKIDIEKKFNVKVSTFAYPYGSFNQNIIDIVKNAGYVAAVSEISGTVQTQNTIFSLSRIKSGVLSGVEGINALLNL